MIAPPSTARSLNSLTRRLFPTPDSPATKTSEGLPSLASANAASSSASSLARPMKRLLVTRVGTVQVSPSQRANEVARAEPAGGAGGLPNQSRLFGAPLDLGLVLLGHH